MSIFEEEAKYVAHTFGRYPIEIVSGKGSVVYDADGKEYIDMGCGIGVTAFGIADDEWQQAIIDQIGKVQHMSNLYYLKPGIELAKIVCEKTGMSKVFFSNSGAEANECAIKAARKFMAEKKGNDCYTIVTLNNSFHGRTLTTLAATGQEHYHELFQPLTPGFISVDAGDMSQLEAAAKEHKLAAVMIECIQGEGGVIPLSQDYLTAVQEFVRKEDILLIIDEVQTGNGRTGKLYSYMHFGLEPDLVSTAKGVAGGLPIGVTYFNEKLANVFAPGDHGSTFGANPVCCAAGISVMSRMTDELMAEVTKKGEFLKETFTGAPGIKDVSGMGLMLGLLTEKPAAKVVEECNAAGVLCLTAKDRVRLLPALNIPMDVLAKAAEIIKKVCAE